MVGWVDRREGSNRVIEPVFGPRGQGLLTAKIRVHGSVVDAAVRSLKIDDIGGDPAHSRSSFRGRALKWLVARLAQVWLKRFHDTNAVKVGDLRSTLVNGDVWVGPQPQVQELGILLVVEIQLNRQAKLPQVALTHHCPRRLPCIPKRRQDDADKKCDDRDHHQQLDQGESATDCAVGAVTEVTPGMWAGHAMMLPAAAGAPFGGAFGVGQLTSTSKPLPLPSDTSAAGMVFPTKVLPLTVRVGRRPGTN